MHACPGNSFRFQGRLHHGVHEVIVRWNSRSFKQPTPHPLTNGRLFSLGSRVCTSILTLQFWHHTNYHFLLVTYPPHAVTSPSLTNLGPVARLDCGEGQTRRTPAAETHFRFQGRLHHGMHEAIVQWNSRSFKHRHYT